MESPKIDIDKLGRPHWSDEAKRNAKTVLEFVQLLMNDHNYEEILRRYTGSPYRQHNRNIADGIQGVIKTVKDFVKTAPEFSYDVKQIYVDGEFVTLHSHATLKEKHRGDDSQGLNIVDTWKLEDGRLVEHWDAIQGIELSMRLYGLFFGGKVRNANGVF
ncbi:MAG: nuclear transport factor 2 family protein [Candidatus Thiodiazotropha taylori]|nr:nuclear transport factor 2 family protein [Candidatus Thiodiazotropha taylori]MCW4275111.1 nuclear transport factor 2 family protein [Candidatus Thiodiazotropha taylori]